MRRARRPRRSDRPPRQDRARTGRHHGIGRRARFGHSAAIPGTSGDGPLYKCRPGPRVAKTRGLPAVPRACRGRGGFRIAAKAAGHVRLMRGTSRRLTLASRKFSQARAGPCACWGNVARRNDGAEGAQCGCRPPASGSLSSPARGSRVRRTRRPRRSDRSSRQACAWTGRHHGTAAGFGSGATPPPEGRSATARSSRPENARREDPGDSVGIAVISGRCGSGIAAGGAGQTRVTRGNSREHARPRSRQTRRQVEGRTPVSHGWRNQHHLLRALRHRARTPGDLARATVEAFRAPASVPEVGRRHPAASRGAHPAFGDAAR